MISFAAQTHLDDCKKLWHLCFHEDYAYIDFFFKNMFAPGRLLVYESAGHAVSMMFLLDCMLEGKKGKYIYAACTHPAFRKRGLMGELLEYAKRQIVSPDEIDFLCLVPATDGLFDYYTKNGFDTFFKICEYAAFACDTAVEKSEEISCEEFCSLRQRFCTHYPRAVSWGDREMQFIYEETRYTGGSVVRSGDGYAVVRRGKPDTIAEWISHETALPACFPAAGNAVMVRRPCPEGAAWEGRDFGMIYTLDQNLLNIKNAYIGLVLD